MSECRHGIPLHGHCEECDPALDEPISTDPDGKKSWDIDPTPNPMRTMIVKLMLSDLKRRIKESPDGAIAYIDLMLGRLDKKPPQ